jgi:hypothetical protein
MEFVMSAPLTKEHMLAIEAKARELQIAIYERRTELFKGCLPSRPVDLLEPGVALGMLGYSLVSVAAIGEYEINGIRGEVAGLIDHGRSEVLISDNLLAPIKRFTVAHELGHAALAHFDQQIQHRDLPFERSGVVRDRKEIEANRYASAFLMPKKVVEEQFRERFIFSPFHLTAETAFALCGANVDKVLEKVRSLRQMSQYLAGASRFNGKFFPPLNEYFKVTVATMAIRLEELDLVDF